MMETVGSLVGKSSALVCTLCGEDETIWDDRKGTMFGPVEARLCTTLRGRFDGIRQCANGHGNIDA